MPCPFPGLIGRRELNKVAKALINKEEDVMYYVKKIASLLLTIFLITLLAFLLFSIIPGDAAIVSLGTEATSEKIEALREQMGLNDNIFVRYGRWILGVFQGDFGTSTYYRVSVSSLLSERLPVTIWLSIISTVIILVVSLPLGVLASKKEGGLVDRIILIISQTIMAIPSFFLGMMIILVFGLILKYFSVGGYISYKEDFFGFLSYMFYPALAIALPKSAMVIKFLRANILKEKKKDYAKTALAIGASEGRVLLKHVLKNSLIPTITFIGVVIAEVLAGSVIVEQVFGIPGIGRLLVFSVTVRDYNVLQAIMLYIGTAVVLVNFVVDILYHIVDPRVE
jgi:peptide/nickel transport system permease protein/oligopeptide transport system permease protein